MATAALAGPLPRETSAQRHAGFYHARLSSAEYSLRTDLPRIDHLAELCRTAEALTAGSIPTGSDHAPRAMR